ncbi:MAG: hypothetical protein FWE08_03270 [Oscillospiraceae bacterium]|nr:hypothetical protein [Oscillospiraceae bacterium]
MMTRQDIRRLVEATVLEHADELLILLLTHKLRETQQPNAKSGCCGGGCGSKKTDKTETPQAKGLLLEEDIIALHGQGQTHLQLAKGTIITPLAADKARDLGIELVR